MRKILSIAAIAMIGLFVFAGCSKKSSSPSYSMKATIGSTAFSENTCAAILSGTTMSITGYNGSATTPPYLSITIYNYTGAKTYTLDSTALIPPVVVSYLPDSNPLDVKAATSGSVIVTSSSSSTVSGTFSLKCSDGTTIANGTFTGKGN